MKITVEIPTALRRFTSGVNLIECSAQSLPELFAQLEERYPDLKRHLRDDSGQVRPFLNVYVNEEDIRFLGNDSYLFQEGDRVLLVPSIAGGAPAEETCDASGKGEERPATGRSAYRLSRLRAPR
jgi:molybdopterin synthase sulfur carrier subunit